MTRSGREYIAGGVAGAGFVALFLGSAMPWWLAGILAGGLYVALRFLLPITPTDEVNSDGVTEAELRALIREGQRHLTTLEHLTKRLQSLHPALSTDLTTLCQLVCRLLQRFEREPKSLHLAGLFPMYLETLASNVQRFVTLTTEHPGISIESQRLQVIEAMVRAAMGAFEQVWERVSREDWLALEAQAETLKALFEADLL